MPERLPVDERILDVFKTRLESIVAHSPESLTYIAAGSPSDAVLTFSGDWSMHPPLHITDPDNYPWNGKQQAVTLTCTTFTVTPKTATFDVVITDSDGTTVYTDTITITSGDESPTPDPTQYAPQGFKLTMTWSAGNSPQVGDVYRFNISPYYTTLAEVARSEDEVIEFHTFPAVKFWGGNTSHDHNEFSNGPITTSALSVGVIGALSIFDTSENVDTALRKLAHDIRTVIEAYDPTLDGLAFDTYVNNVENVISISQEDGGQPFAIVALEYTVNYRTLTMDPKQEI